MAKKKKDQKNKQVLMTLFLAFIMITSILGYQFGQEDVVRYNGYKFVQRDTQLTLNIGGKEVYFYTFPDQAEGFDMPEDVKVLLGAPLVFVTYDINSSLAESMALAQYELVDALPVKNVYAVPALTTNTTYAIQQWSCDNATMTQPVIYFILGNTTSLQADDKGCIIAQARSSFDVLFLKDIIQYRVLGVVA